MRVLQGFLYIIVFYMTIVLFLPKNEIVSFIETKFLVQEQVSSKAELNNKFFGYTAINSQFFYQNNSIFKVKKIDISPYLFYNSLDIDSINLEGMAGSIFPSKIQKATAIYSILNPRQVTLNISGDFGKAQGYFDIVNMVIHLEIDPSSLMKKNYMFLLNRMKKVNQNYIYEFKI